MHEYLKKKKKEFKKKEIKKRKLCMRLSSYKWQRQLLMISKS